MAYKNKEKELQKNKEYYQKNKKRIRLQHKEYYQKNKEGRKDYYQKNKEKINKRMRLYGKKWYQENKERMRLQHREYYQKNKEKVLLYHKKWYQENKEKILQQSKDYYKKNWIEIQQRHKNYHQKNKEKFLQYKRSWQRYTRKTNPKYRLDENMGTAICISLKNAKAGRKWETLVDYTLEELMEFLGKQFDDKMAWNNYGSYWAVDHIKPKSLFNYISSDDLEFKQCWSLNNLQPLEKIKNIQKGNRYNKKLIPNI